MAWFIADTHFGDERILRFCSRPFKDVDEMDKAIIKNINANVQAEDTLWILGDFAKDPRKVFEYRAQIECEDVRLVIGNHDEKYVSFYMVPAPTHKTFQFATAWPVVLYDFLILSHEPMFVNGNSPYLNAHGYVHNALPYRPTPWYWNLSCDVTDFAPVSFEKIKSELDAQKNLGEPCDIL